MKARKQYATLGARIKNYTTGEAIGKHGAIAQAIGNTCTSLLTVVDQEKRPGTHRVIRAIGRIADITALAANTSTQVAGVLRNPETPGVPPVTTETIESSTTSVPSEGEVLRAIGVSEVTITN